MIKFFKYLAHLEGISLILLLFLAMPMKYLFDQPVYVKHIGMIHGVLFVVYVIFALFLAFTSRVNFFKLLIISIIPFGTFLFLKKIITIQ